ncbi:sensor histidine kinase [Lacticaseibacillus brantae]|uniref:histidine kinase n=1 Tax=Lacticaseibacillus brantae DSM 23927 TaxID=1423727 RepID=A0A0R2B0Y3_9LACO|nr:HAMP domain-containing sensor histidine kinase [Lacticaseibacillus brantae]KRM72992.1 two component sensor transduction histidine kinase [Lacticaseibacillus brantae DSM 23927]
MKLIYQQMLAFLGVILVTLAVISILFIRSTTNTVWENNFTQLEQYTEVLKNNSLVQVGDNQFMINSNFIATSENVLQDQHVHFIIYNSKNTAVYPTNSSRTPRGIDDDDWAQLKKGNAVSVRELARNPADGSQQSMTIYYKPVFLSGKLLFVISAFAPVETIQTAIGKTEHNLLIGFLLSMLAAIIVSYIVARYQVRRINQLRQATHQVMNGDYDAPIATKFKGHDEITDLAIDFQNMVNSLKASEAEIERQEGRRRQFMADAAHEMRTPLTTINGILEGLAYDVIPEESKAKSIELMRNETNRLIRLVNENLDYEKIRTNQIILKKTQFNGQVDLANIVEQLKQKADAANDDVVLNAPAELTVYADHDRFVQVVFNIVQNAIQFTDHGTITITAKNGVHQTEISVSDTGIGMTADQVKNIWERYYKADPSRKNTAYGESGLGLAIVHQLISLHGGSIEVDSKLHEGTTFSFTFPDEATAPKQKAVNNGEATEA